MHPDEKLFAVLPTGLTLLGFYRAYQSKGDVFQHPPSRQPRALKLSRMIAYFMFYRICKIENPLINLAD